MHLLDVSFDRIAHYRDALKSRYRVHETLKRAVFKMMDDTGPETFIRQQKAIISNPDSRPSLGMIHCPTRVLVGNEDALTPVSVALTIADGTTGSKLEIVQDCGGHLSTIERPDAVTEALRAWLDL